MGLASRLIRRNNSFFPEGTTPNDQRRVALLVFISSVGILFLIILSGIAFLQGNPTLGTLDTLTAVLLMINLIDARLRKHFNVNISVGIFFVSLFFIYLYVTGGVGGTAFVWYFTYPLIACYLLGSRIGGVVSALMLIPVLTLLLIAPMQSFFAQYSLSFVVRFIAAYMVTCSFAYFFEQTREKNETEITKINQGLEKLVSIRTQELAESNEQLKKDILKRETAERAMQESEKRYRSVFEKSTDAIFIVDKRTGRYIDVNESGVQLTGRSRSELRQLTTQDVVPGGAQERLKLVDDSNTNLDFGKVTYLRPDGTQRAALLSTLPIDSENVMGIARDITDELVMAEQLRQTQKMEAIGTLAGGIAHDFNNILSAILGYSELVLAELPADSSIKHKIEAIYSSGERARDLVSQILTFSRKDEHAKLLVELRVIIKDALKILRPAIPATIEIQTQLDSKGPILADPSRIHQVIMNLCTNASQAMLTTGGKLNISLSDTIMEGEAATNAQVPAGNYVKLVISDTGTGIPPEQMNRIFDPFFTTKEVGKGTGLGLSVVHGIIKRHNGAILVESEVGRGTEFLVYLPLSTKTSHDEKPKVELTTGDAERILLVDDEHDILKIETEMLKTLGYSVTATSNPSDALELFAKQPEGFDLVITDMTMPNMTGDKLALELDKIHPNVPTILCTDYSELMSQEKAASLGVNAFLMKPISMVDFSNTIRMVLD